MRSVSGNIVLPSGVAPSGGISADIVVPTEKTVESNSKNSGGRRFASYTAYVPAGKDYKVKYTVDAKSDYATDGYYG